MALIAAFTGAVASAYAIADTHEAAANPEIPVSIDNFVHAATESEFRYPPMSSSC